MDFKYFLVITYYNITARFNESTSISSFKLLH